MDEVFGGAAEERFEEDAETTSLLRNEHRRTSIASYMG
jgi:hypothetical protein